MGDLPRIDRPGKAAIRIRTQPGWEDHHVQGQPVLPAVEAMQILAGRIQAARPALDVGDMSAARFPKFLAVDPDRESLDVDCRIVERSDGGLQAALTRSVTTGSAGIRRSITHAEMTVGSAGKPPSPLPLDLAAAIEGICDTIAPEVIYRELVPFGPGFRSICRPLVVSPDGALARVQAPSPASALPGPLGSGFPLDGAFHAACVWGQRHARRVAFPVAIGRRIIFSPTRGDESYTARVVPKAITPGHLTVDIWILDHTGNVCEAALGVEMRDVSRGTWRPPGWIVEKAPESALGLWAADCQGLVLIERAHMAAFAASALSALEAARMANMGLRRRQGYVGGRLALKRLWRKLAGDDHQRPSAAIETGVADDPRPYLSGIDGKAPAHCSLAHDERFCVAVAHSKAVGIDVEPISDRARRSGHLFMQACEQGCVQQTDMDAGPAALRVWSIKEAASKAFGMVLNEAWERIAVVSIGEAASCFKKDGGPAMTARHLSVAGHLLTLVTEPVSNRI
ncbi:polyketide synthase dehydratase domain-containing protein [Desulfosarcina ovata]|uniref:PKS/mFAS DH domain-containing protein n=1 Tax=Desulfosarcina ovata subsp. ovata TaxID=2752305 RepID=A0A5K8A8J2_9BACT|nr:polyketide synthase dehydratase domain-containing protein [Desulfosarcina ovata]BBO88857.1 hypothetical protein DSCOOX_20370 [Desulfosarcina ovata subsp. ovata]